MNPQDVMLLFIKTSQEHLVIHFVYLQLSCTTSNFGSLTRRILTHHMLITFYLVSPPEGSVPSPEFIWTYNWDLLDLVTTQVSSSLAGRGKIWIYEALDPCKAHFLMRMIPLKNLKILKLFGVATSVTITIYEVCFDIYTAALWIRKKTRHKVDKGYGE